MAQITVEEVYHGEKHGIIGQVEKDLLENCLGGKDLHTLIELLVVKHALAAAEKMKKEGDFVSEINDMESLSCYVEEKVCGYRSYSLCKLSKLV